MVAFAACGGNKVAEKKEEIKKNQAPHYQLATVKQGGVATSIKLPAQLAAYLEVSIFPKVNGYVKTVSVDIGSKVKKGDLLMTIEAPELLQAAMQAREKYVRAQSDLSIDKEHYQRLLEAAQTPGAISPFDLSTVKNKLDADNALSNAERANWEMQKTMLSYLNVTAPFDGVITARNVHPGALVSDANKSVPMLELKQIEHLRLQVDIPESATPDMHVGDSIIFYVNAFPGKPMKGIINRKSDNVNTEFRSERVEIDVWNKTGVLAPGMYVDVILDSKGNANALVVPTSAVVTSTQRKYVIVMRNNEPVKIDVSTGNQTTDSTEIFGNLQAGEQVIVGANDEMK
jgi:RND family efflux transporter MFP subunit